MAARALPGQAESGDRQAIKITGDGALVAVVDGLGHGDEAASAARIAIATLEAHPDESVIPLVRRCHEHLYSTRGVVMSVASFNAHEGTMTWLGVGNVEGILVRGDPLASPRYESLLLRGGVVGRQLPALFATILAVMPGDTLILATDGIRRELATVAPGDVPQRTANGILARYATGTDDALVVVARYCGKV